MKTRYIPILKAMRSECRALKQMRKQEAVGIRPLFEVPRITNQLAGSSRFRNVPDVTTAHLREVASRIGDAWTGRPAMFDFYQWEPDAVVETGEHVIPYFFRRLAGAGVKVAPVVGYDRWDSAEYRQALLEIQPSEAAICCLRLDSDAIGDAAEPEFFIERIEEILSELDLDASKCILLLDFGDVTQKSVNEIVAAAAAVIRLVGSIGFRLISTAGCSLPASIDRAIPTQDTSGMVLRREMMAWQALRLSFPGVRLRFGDYGVRGPFSNEGIPAKHANGKIRHTSPMNFYIARGHSMMLRGKGEQMWDLARDVIESGHYLGAEFSWGDARILACSQGEFKGGHPEWIEIDTNHHLVFVSSEIVEFEIAHAEELTLSESEESQR